MTGESGNGVVWRLDNLDSRVKKIEDLKPDVQAERLRNLSGNVNDLSRVVESLRKTLIGFALTIAGSAIVFAFSILVATGRI